MKYRYGKRKLNGVEFDTITEDFGEGMYSVWYFKDARHGVYHLIKSFHISSSMLHKVGSFEGNPDVCCDIKMPGIVKIRSRL